jgi:hypothetical protein
MNLAIRGIDGQIAHGDTFHNDRFPHFKADFILANPPFNVSDWGLPAPSVAAVCVQRTGRRAAARRQALAVRRRNIGVRGAFLLFIAEP